MSSTTTPLSRMGSQGEDSAGLPPVPTRRDSSESPGGSGRPASAAVYSATPPRSPGKAGFNRPATASAASPGYQRHKRHMAFGVSRAHGPEWNADASEFSLTRPLTPRGGVPKTYRPHSSSTYGNLDAGTINRPSVRGEFGSRPSSAVNTARLSSTYGSMWSTGSVRGSDLREAGREDTVVVRPALPYQVVREADESDQSLCHVGVQSAATTWTRFFHGIGQNASTGLKKGNPFYQYFDVYLDPDPLGPIHVAGKGGGELIGGEEAAEKRTREEMDSFFRRSHERLYFVTGAEPVDVFVDVAHMGEEAKQGWPAMGKEREHERLNLIEYTRYVSRLHPRSADDMKQLMRLQAGLLRHMQHELAESEKEVSNRVRGIEARLKGDYGERMDRANAELSTATMECTNLRQSLRDAERETQDLRRKLLDTDQRLRAEANESAGQQQKLQQQLADALRQSEALGEELETLKAARDAEVKGIREELDRVSENLKEAQSKREQAVSDLKLQKASAKAREKELLGSFSAMLMTGKVSLPSVPCYLPMSADIRTAQLPPLPDAVNQTYNVSVPPDTSVHLPTTWKGTASLRPGSQVLAKKLGNSPPEVDRVQGAVTKEMPSGATLKLPRAAWGGDGNLADDVPEEYEDTGTNVALPIGSVVTLAVTQRQKVTQQAEAEGTDASGDGNEESAEREAASMLESGDEPTDVQESEGKGSKGDHSLRASSYRLRAVTVPTGSLVILPTPGVHHNVNRYSLQLPRLSVVKLPLSEMVSSEELEKEAEESGNTDEVAVVSLTAAEVGQRFSVKEDADGFVALDLKPASVIIATGSASLDLKLPEGSTIVVGPGSESGNDNINHPPSSPAVVAADPLEPRVAELEAELLKLRESMFPLELIRTRLRHLMEALGGLEDPQGANALSMGVLIEVFRREPHRGDGGVLAISREEDAPVGGFVAFEAAKYSAVESSGGVTVTLKRRGGSKGAIGVVLNTFDGGAAAGADYQPVKELKVEWADGDTADRTVALRFIDDNFYEGDESFFLCITDVMPSADTIFAIGMVDICEVVIVDDDSRPAPGKAMSWGEVSVDTKMPWDVRGVVRHLRKPEALNEGRWKKQTQSKSKPMKQENLRTFLKNMIQAKRNADVVDDSTGAPRASMPEFYKFYIEYTYGTDTGPTKHASILRAMRQLYRLNNDPFVSMCTSMIGFYDPAPPRISDLVCKISNMLSTSLIACNYSPPKFWSRFNGNLRLSPHEMRNLHTDLYAQNAKAKHKPFHLDPAGEGLKALQALLLQEAGSTDGNLDEEHALNLSSDEKPTIPVSSFLLKTLQHTIVETSERRPALRQLVESFAAMDPHKGVLMLGYDQFTELMDVLDPNTSEERRAHFYLKVLRLDTTLDLTSVGKMMSSSNRPSRSVHGGRGSLTDEAIAEEGGSKKFSGGNDGDGGELPGQTDAAAGAVEVVAGDAKRLQVKNWSQAQKMSIAADELTNVMFDELDFIFCTSCS